MAASNECVPGSRGALTSWGTPGHTSTAPLIPPLFPSFKSVHTLVYIVSEAFYEIQVRIYVIITCPEPQELSSILMVEHTAQPQLYWVEFDGKFRNIRLF